MKKSLVLFTALLTTATFVQAQNQQQPEPSPVIITTVYLPPIPEDLGFRLDSLMMYYVDKGIRPNPMYKNFHILTHWWGADNEKFLMVYEVDKFENINKAEDKTRELIDSSFKTDDEKKTFWKRYDKYFNHHDDNIMREFGTPKM